MSSSSMHGRHRAPRTISTLAALSAAVSSNAGSVGRQAAVIVAASGLVLTSAVAANAADLQPRRDVAGTKLTVTVERTTATVVAASTTSVTFDRVPVKVTAAPVVVAPEQAPAPVEASAPAPVVASAEVAPVPAAAAPAVAAPVAAAQNAVAAPAAAAPVAVAPAAAAPVAAEPVAAPAAAPAAKPAPAPSSGVAATIAAAARGQLGVMQDCTRLASNSLAAAGINFHGWPAGYLSLGRTVSAGEAIPGDLIYDADGGMGAAHIAVYIGGGQAVHGGFNGNTTVIAPAELGSGGVYIRVGG